MFEHQKGMEQATQYWDEKCATSASTHERVEQNRRPQRMRYESLVINNDLNDCTVLDVGCGAGDFLYHLQQRKLKVNYTGTDISGNMVKACQTRFPGHEFQHVDINNLDSTCTFDYVVSFGIHNIRVESAWDILKLITRKQFELCEKAAHISILTDRYSGFDSHIQSWKAEEVLKFALEITPYVVLRHDYLPNDFSITLYREPMIDTRDVLLLDYD